VALVDDEDFEYLNQWKWQATIRKKGSYVSKTGGARMHNMIMNPPKGLEVDHADRDGFNNQKFNLRFASRAENNSNQGIRVDNTSGLKSVTWHKRIKKWQVRLQKEGKRMHLGYYNTKEEAAKVYNEMAKKQHGQFAYLNTI